MRSRELNNVTPSNLLHVEYLYAKMKRITCKLVGADPNAKNERTTFRKAYSGGKKVWQQVARYRTLCKLHL